MLSCHLQRRRLDHFLGDVISLLFYLVVYLGASIPEIVEKCDRFDPFPGVFAKYHGKREGDPVKKECEEQKKEQPTMSLLQLREIVTQHGQEAGCQVAARDRAV